MIQTVKDAWRVTFWPGLRCLLLAPKVLWMYCVWCPMMHKAAGYRVTHWHRVGFNYDTCTRCEKED